MAYFSSLCSLQRCPPRLQRPWWWKVRITNLGWWNCFGTIFPNLNFVFASIWAARLAHFESDQYRCCSTVKQAPAVGATPSTPIGEQPKTALWLWVREMTCYLYTRGVRGRMKAKQRRFEVTRELCHESWFHHFRHHFPDGHWTHSRLPLFYYYFRVSIAPPPSLYK